MVIREELLEELLRDYKKPEDLLGDEGILKDLTKALIDKALKGELNHHLGYNKSSKEKKETENRRNGKYTKKILTKDGELEIEVCRDRAGTFEPEIIKKNQRRFEGFDNKIIAMYGRGMSTRDIQGHLEEIYGTQVSADLISTVTEEVMEEVEMWQNRPLDSVYPIMYLDAIRIKVRDTGRIINKAINLVLGVNMSGNKELLGIWIAQTEGAKFWLSIVTDLKNRGVEDIFIACVDGLKGFPEAILSVYPKTEIQKCIVHMIRYSLNYVPYKDRKEVAGDLKNIYTAINEENARFALDLFKEKWDKKYPMIYETWNNNWTEIIPFLSYPDYIRKAIYTTNAIESLNHSLRKVVKTKAVFPNDNSVKKILYLALKNISKRWTMPIREWKLALNQFAILFGERFPENKGKEKLAFTQK